MTNKTVGGAGDYATWDAAMAALAAASPLSDDWDFLQIADTVEIATTLWRTVDFNGYSVTLRNQSPHGGDPTVGYKCTGTGTNITAIKLQISGAGSIEIKDLQMAFTASGVNAVAVMVTTSGPDVAIHDIIATNPGGQGWGVYAALPASSPSTDIFIWNVIADGWARAMYLQISYVANWLIDNCTLVGGGYTGLDLPGGSGSVGTIKNCAVSSITGGAQAFLTGINNASVDTRAQDSNWGTGSGNEINITLANEFVSTTIGNTDYMKVRNDGGGVCFDGGATPSIGANTAGIRGDQRPQANSDVSIGADEFPSAPSPGGGGGSGSGGGGISGAITAAMAAGY
jgi:hypothetical protein